MMMDSTHILEPAFRVVPPSSLSAGMSGARGAAQKARSAGEHLGQALNIFVFGLLERLNVCRLPRVVSVECLIGECSRGGAAQEETRV